MSYTYTRINGERVEANVANAFYAMAAEFKRVWGLDLIVSSGTRTREEQAYLYNGWINRLPGFNLAAPPGSSNHEEYGPTGPRALDLRDSGGDAGVTVIGSARSNWLAANSGRWGFRNAGHYFSPREGWHYEYTGSLGGSGGGGGGTGGNFDQTTANEQNWMQNIGIDIGSHGADGIIGPDYENAVRTYQTMLRAYGYTGDIDGKWGAGTQAAHEKFYADWYSGGGKIAVDGQWGPATTKVLQARLGVEVDGQLGYNTIRALQTWLGVTADGEMGYNTISALQKAVGSPVDGELGPNTVRALQASLNAGGFAPHPTTPPVTPPTDGKLVEDGEWGPATTNALQKKLGVTVTGEMNEETYKALQKATGQVEDGLVGPITIKALQMNVGVEADGQLGPITVTALQKFLNANKNFQKVTVKEDTGVKYPQPEAPTYPGAVKWGHSPSSSPRGDNKVKWFIVHHWGAASLPSASAQWASFMKDRGEDGVAPTWQVNSDGSVYEAVPPDTHRAWASGKADYQSVCVETQNTSAAPNWGISEASHEAIAKLVVWASKRYGFPIDRNHVFGDREIEAKTGIKTRATICPGPSMDLDKIVELAKKYAEEPTPPVDPVDPVDPETWTVTISKDEAVAAGKAVDTAMDILKQIRKLLP